MADLTQIYVIQICSIVKKRAPVLLQPVNPSLKKSKVGKVDHSIHKINRRMRINNQIQVVKMRKKMNNRMRNNMMENKKTMETMETMETMVDVGEMQVTADVEETEEKEVDVVGMAEEMAEDAEVVDAEVVDAEVVDAVVEAVEAIELEREKICICFNFYKFLSVEIRSILYGVSIRLSFKY